MIKFRRMFGNIKPDAGQEAFKRLMKSFIAPGLRQLGLKGSGTSFYLPNDDNYVLIGFQKSMRNHGHSVRFTINITVANKEEWSAQRKSRHFLPPQPAPNTLYGDFIWQKRIGTLLPGGNDKWWEVTSASDLQEISSDVLAILKEYAIPAIRLCDGY